MFCTCGFVHELVVNYYVYKFKTSDVNMSFYSFLCKIHMNLHAYLTPSFNEFKVKVQ